MTSSLPPVGGIDPANWSCPVPLRDHPNIVLGHGGGGRLSAELIEHLFLPALATGAGPLAQLGDSALLTIEGTRVAMTTDSYVVRPRFFPGGNIGDLAVNGTVNDLAVVGARPLYLSVATILEEGIPLVEVASIAETMGSAARAAGVQFVTGDTKVVDLGHGDGMYLNTSGIGLIAPDTDLGPHRLTPGDVVIVSGPIGAHGIAVLSVREGLEFGSDIRSDTAALNGMVASLLSEGIDVHMMRDPTRGGVAATCNEIAAAAGLGIALVERDIPVADDVRAACGFLGLDPLYVANEGRLVAFVARTQAEAALETIRAHPHGTGARIIGEVVSDHPGIVLARTGIGGSRVVDLPLAEQLPRIC